MVVCLYMLALQQVGDLPRVYPNSHPMTDGIGSSLHPHNLELDKWKEMDGWILVHTLKAPWVTVFLYKT